MYDLSFHDSFEHIHSNKSKEYFKEVLSSYYNGNYRAAIVTLYSVVICDVIFKLEDLVEIYSDSVAKEILDKIKSIQKEQPTNPDWEKTIIEEVKNRTSLFDNVDIAHINSLRMDRHLCAHPVISKEDKLYTPCKENVASHIRNMLNSLLLKPPILSKKVINTILKDISENRDIFVDDESVTKYISAKYLTKLNSDAEVKIFRDLWKFVFKLEDTEAEKNRLNNYRVLYVIYSRNSEICKNIIKNQIAYYSRIRNEQFIYHLLIRFLSENEFLFVCFTEDVKLLVNRYAHDDISSQAVAWFLSESYLSHLLQLKESIIENIKNLNLSKKEPVVSAYDRLFKIGISKGFVDDVVDFITWRYLFSSSYAVADSIFTYLVKPNIKYFSPEKLKNLCKGIEDNSQTFDRNQASEDHKILKSFCRDKIGEDFDATQYPNTFKSC